MDTLKLYIIVLRFYVRQWLTAHPKVKAILLMLCLAMMLLPMLACNIHGDAMGLTDKLFGG